MLSCYLALLDDDGEKPKFERIYDAYRDLMYYAANRILEDPRESEDVVHQAFFKILEILDKIPEATCPQTRSLVVTIVKRMAIDVYRRRKRRGALPLEDWSPGAAVPPQTDAAADGLVFAQAIARLPERYRAVLLLKYDNGYSDREIADIMDMTEANVKKTTQRAKAKLRAILEEMEADLL